MATPAPRAAAAPALSKHPDMRHVILSRRGLRTSSLNRRRAIRRHCLMCADFKWAAVVGCDRSGCRLHRLRAGGRLNSGLSAADRRRAIADFCRECCDGKEAARQGCDVETCALHPYRNG